jgi:hypothetical protein
MLFSHPLMNDLDTNTEHFPKGFVCHHEDIKIGLNYGIQNSNDGCFQLQIIN